MNEKSEWGKMKGAQEKGMDEMTRTHTHNEKKEKKNPMKSEP